MADLAGLDQSNLMTSRPFLILAAFCTAGCTQTAHITVLSSSGFYGGDATTAYVTFRSSQPLHRFDENVRPAEAVSYICGEYERFNMTGSLVETGSQNVYSASFPPMSRRAIWRSNGQVDQGWPVELAEAKGICLRVEAAQMLNTSLTTNEVVVPRESYVR